MSLPPFPVDDLALDLIEHALSADAETTLRAVRRFYSGAPPEDEVRVLWESLDDSLVETDQVVYHPNSIILAQTAEIRRLRRLVRRLQKRAVS